MEKTRSFGHIITQELLNTNPASLEVVERGEIDQLSVEMFGTPLPKAIRTMFGHDSHTWAALSNGSPNFMYFGFAEKPNGILNSRAIILVETDQDGPAIKFGGSVLDSKGTRRGATIKYSMDGLQEAYISIHHQLGDIQIPAAHLTTYSSAMNTMRENPYTLSSLLTPGMVNGIPSGRLLRIGRNLMNERKTLETGGYDIAQLSRSGLIVSEDQDQVTISHNLPQSKWTMSFPQHI